MKVGNALFIAASISLFSACERTEEPEPLRQEAPANILFRTLLGRVPNKLADANLLEKVSTLLAENKGREAAKLLTTQDEFILNTGLGWARPLTNLENTTFHRVDQNRYIPEDENDKDAEQLILSILAQDMDARKILTADDTDKTVPQPSIYTTKYFNLKLNLGLEYTSLSESEYKREVLPHQLAGVLTTRRWTQQFLGDGTHRRNIQYALERFLCKPLENWMDTSLPDHWVGRDVDRAPGDDPEIFQKRCIGCHAGMDAMRGAFAYWSERESPNFISGRLNRNSEVFPGGKQVVDDSWENYWVHSSPIKSGRGPHAFGKMLSESDEFPQCMAQTVYQHVCRRSGLDSQDKEQIAKLTSTFKNEGYRLKTLFEEAALSPDCEKDLGVRNHIEQEIYLGASLGVGDPVIPRYFSGNSPVRDKLAEKGSPTEISASYLNGSIDVAYTYCDFITFSKVAPVLTFGGVHVTALMSDESSTSSHWFYQQAREFIAQAAEHAWGIPPTEEELKVLVNHAMERTKLDGSVHERALEEICTIIYSSPLALIR